MQLADEKLEEIKLLTDLGLTVSQAKIYLALNEREQSSAKVLAQLVCIDRANIYRIIGSLQKIGLIERKLTPKGDIFVSVPLKEGIQFLVERKKHDLIEIQDDAQRIISLLKAKSTVTDEEIRENFNLVPQGEANGRAFIRGLNEAQYCLDDVINWDGFKNAMLYSYSNYYKSLKQGVIIKYVTNVPEKTKIADEIILIVKKLGKRAPSKLNQLKKPLQQYLQFLIEIKHVFAHPQRQTH